MSRRDDVNSKYKLYDTLQKYINITFVINALSALLSMFSGESYLKYFIFIQIVVTSINIVLSWLNNNIIFPTAEESRRKVGIKDGLNINITNDVTKEYYNNELSPSIDRFILNNYESIFHSYRVAKKMIFPQAIKIGTSLIVLLIAFSFLPGSNYLLFIFQLVFSSTYIIGFIDLILYIIRLNKIEDTFYLSLVTDPPINKTKVINLLCLSTEYEVIKGSQRIKLNTAIFMKHQEKLADEWDTLQKKICESFSRI